MKNPEDQGKYTFGGSQAAVNLLLILEEHGDKSVSRNISRLLTKHNAILNRLKVGDDLDRYVASVMHKEAIGELLLKGYDQKIIDHTRNVMSMHFREWLRAIYPPPPGLKVKRKQNESNNYT